MNLLLAVASGCLVPLSLAPFSFWGFGILALTGLVLSLRTAAPRQAMLLAWLFGTVSFAAGVSWVFVAMHSYGEVSAPLAVIMTGLFCAGLGLIPALFGYVYARWLRGSALVQPLGFAAGWTVFEWLRGWILTGFPWLYIGYGHVHSPLAGWAPVLGIHGLNFIVALSAAALAALFLSLRQSAAKTPALLAVLGCTALYALGASLNTVEWTQPSDRPPLSIGAVQANIDQGQKWAYSNYWQTLELYDQASEALWPLVDVVIWPEAAIPALYHHAEPFFDYMRERAERNDTTLITGVPTRNGEAMHNSVLVVSGGEGIYHKQRLVPFGEYVPLGNLIRGLIPFFDLPMSSFSLGGADQQPLNARGWQLAPSICYEIVYPDLVARGAQDVDLLFTISNDAWFGHSLGPEQHMQMAQMRALENGRELVRVTGSGITATVDHRGNILERAPAFTATNLVAEVHARQGQTPFNRFGSAPVLALAGLLCLAQLLANRKPQ